MNIDIDDEEKPFKLKNLNRRFSGTQLTEFLAGYISQTDGVISIVVHSSTKRNAEGEREVVELLTQRAEQGKVLVVYLPPPTGFDPDTALRKYAESFPTDQPENIKPSLSVYIPDHAMQNQGRFRIGIQEVNMQDFETTLRNQLATNRYGRLIVNTGKAGEPYFEQLAAQIATENKVAVEMAEPPTSYLLPIERQKDRVSGRLGDIR